MAEKGGYTRLEQFDLAALLRIADKSWYDMRTIAYLPTSARMCVREMVKVRNNWAHFSGDIFDKDLIINDLETILNFFEMVLHSKKYTKSILDFKTAIEHENLSATKERTTALHHEVDGAQPIPCANDATIGAMDEVYLTSSPETKGIVVSVSEVNGTKCYCVFVDGNKRTFYEGQIAKGDTALSYNWVDVNTFLCNLIAHKINNPSADNLYSLNSARIDFIPYQFRPALKMIKSDEPRILIADSVGVGKTIEAGLIIKELEARANLENILIICPKPLVAERKWELEMKRFDEDFFPLDAPALRQVLSDTHRDGAWPTRYNKAIVPYSILDSKVYHGETGRRGKKFGLLDLDPRPHFDLVIIDEAHHIRNGSIDRDKAFAYKCVRYFCEQASAVVMLTATPLQTQDDDLFTLLNLLRPDVVMDQSTFRSMSKPNEFISHCSHIARSKAEGWQKSASEMLQKVTTTQWGETVIAKNPLYHDILKRLEGEEMTREDRVKLISDIESLHSFHNMINRTRRKDIQDFCVRKPHTIETKFTKKQAELHKELLDFASKALSILHENSSVAFMMSTLRRQAASCLFGLAPQIRDIVSRRFEQMADDPDIDVNELDLDAQASTTLEKQAQYVIRLAESLPNDDPKFDSMLKIIEEKQKSENNKVIIFSTFRHTLNYICEKLKALHYRVAQINGSVGDETRRELRACFEMDRSQPEALDILLFTEVGSEGLDYQFCDTMINYDLPWNPMRIEQRIGRIDRRGQKSEVVNIYNLITEGTVDADIYTRCLTRIGIFEKSIGECEEVLGAIGSKIEKIVANARLSHEEACKKLEDMADNEVRRMQELSKLEEEESALFGFNLSNYTASKEIQGAESPWLSPLNMQILVERYLNKRLGKGEYIIGSSDLKQIRLGKEARNSLLNDYGQLTHIKTGIKREWESYLKGNEALHQVTFLSETAAKERKAFFITPTHPLVKQAAKYFSTDKTSYIHLEYHSDNLAEGNYPFSIYAWNYVGIRPSFKVVLICSLPEISKDIFSIIQDSTVITGEFQGNQDTWAELEPKHFACWQEEKAKFYAKVQEIANYKLQCLGDNYRNRKRSLEQKIHEAADEKIRRMYSSELESATENYNSRVSEINTRKSRADIHTTLIANGIINIRKG